MRADGLASLGGHEQDGEDLVDTGESARVDLNDVDGLGLEELLEDHSVVTARTRGGLSVMLRNEQGTGQELTRALQSRHRFRRA